MVSNILIQKIPAHTTWPLRHRVMWPDQPMDYIKLPHDDDAEHFGLFEDGSLVSVVSLFVNDNQAQFRKLATDTKSQGKGYGTLLLKFVFDKAISYPINKIWCNARADKLSFYKRFGMEETDKLFVKGGLDYVIMEKRVG